MKSPKAPTPSQAELDGQAQQAAMLKKQNDLLDQQEAQRRADTEENLKALSGNRVGMRSLLTGGWSGFTRGGDLGGR